MFAINLVLNFIFNAIFGEQQNPVADELSTAGIIFLGILFVPYIETFLCQALPIWVLRKLIKRPRYNLIPCILVSAIIFGLQHTYSWQYMLGTFIFGIPMAALYYLCRYRRENAFIVVFAYHALWNAFGFLLD